MTFTIIMCLFVVCGGLSAADDGCDLPDNQVRVVYIDKMGHRFSSSFHVEGISVFVRYGCGKKEFPVIMPLSHFIRDQFLSGVLLRQEDPPPSFSALYSLKDVDHTRCQYVTFSTNKYMKEIFSSIFPAMLAYYEERVTTHDGWDPLSNKELTKAFDLPGKSMKWVITHRGELAQRMQARCGAPVCFLIDPEGGILKGTPVESSAELSRVKSGEAGNFFHYKVARARDDLMKTYPWSLKKQQQCILQAEGETTLPFQLKFANKLVEDSDQVRVIYFPGDGASKYSVVYNTSGITCQAFYAVNGKSYAFVQPLSRYLQDQFLLGYRFAHGDELPGISSSQFCLKDITSPKCAPLPFGFYSEQLRYCCETIFPKISAKQDHVVKQSQWPLLSGEMLRTAFPRNAVVQWSPASIKDVQGSVRNLWAEVYIIVRDAGILKGVADVEAEGDRWLEEDIPPESLLESKLLCAEEDLMKTYPWTKEKAKFCL